MKQECEMHLDCRKSQHMSEVMAFGGPLMTVDKSGNYRKHNIMLDLFSILRHHKKVAFY